MAAVAMWPTAQAAAAPCSSAAPGDIWGWGRAVLCFALEALLVLVGRCGPACQPQQLSQYQCASLISDLIHNTEAACHDQHGFAAIRHPLAAEEGAWKLALQPLTITMCSTNVHTMAALLDCSPVSGLRYTDCS